MIKTLFIVNNLSGTVSKYNIPYVIDMYLDKEKFEYSIEFIDDKNKDMDYTSILKEGYKLIISVGGDGTLLELSEEITNLGLKVGIIPIGSGNGFATHLGYKPRNIEYAFKIINNYNPQAVDIAKINNKHFFSNFGIGLDSKIARDFKVKKKRGLLTYGYLSLRRLFRIHSSEIEFEIEGERTKVETYFFNIFNSSMFGYGFGIEPTANAFDGKLDLCYIDKCSYVKFPWIGLCLAIKKPQWITGYHHRLIDSITIINNKTLLYQVDGDPKVTKQNIEISVIKSGIEVLI